MRLDLHVHTYASGDSTTSVEELAALVGPDDVVAVTDHHSLRGALELRAILSGRVIVGEEIDTGQGELIGLFLAQRVARGLGLLATANLIRRQGGLVVAPHPLDERRRGVGEGGLVRLAEARLLDVVEVANAKQPSRDERAREIAARYGVAMGAGSDAHVPAALGSSYVVTDRLSALSPRGLLDALWRGCVVHRHCDPTRPWPRPVVRGS